ncbi:MAG: hypothetical protein KC777_10930 [Cyanobacteria bacterium HKST-UBA02]|nr:hypothetical protein [Cyanobacteria bacterium HKST-UBA02]
MTIIVEALPDQEEGAEKGANKGAEKGPSEVDHVELNYHDRCRPRQRVSTTGGRELALALPRGTVLADGVVLHRDQGLVVSVIAKPEKVVRIQPDGHRQLCLVAHHLGNWHRSLETLEDGSVLAELDGPLEDWLKRQGIGYSIEERAYQPNLKGDSHD